MRHPFIVTAIGAAALVSAGLLLPDYGLAQQGARPSQPPSSAPIKPYKAIAVTLPQPMNDSGLEALRKQLADIAKRKDRAALAKLVVPQGFFWLQDKDRADKQKPGIESLAKAMELDGKEGLGWEGLAGFAADPTARPMPGRTGVVCSPAGPNFDSNALEAVVKSTQTDPNDWGFTFADGTEVRAAAQPNAPVIEKLGLILVRVIPDDAAPADNAPPAFVHVATPSGKSGFVAVDAIVPLAGDVMCYAKDAIGWKIAGYIGGSDQ